MNFKKKDTPEQWAGLRGGEKISHAALRQLPRRGVFLGRQAGFRPPCKGGCPVGAGGLLLSVKNNPSASLRSAPPLSGEARQSYIFVKRDLV